MSLISRCAARLGCRRGGGSFGGVRRFNTSDKPTREESARARSSADRQESIWNTMVPDRNWGVTHPAFFGMLAAICGLHYYNSTWESPSDGKSDSVLLEEQADLADRAKALREKTLAEAERQRQARKKNVE